MLALLLDLIGSFFIAKKLRHWAAWSGAAIALGVCSAFLGSLAIHYVLPGEFTGLETALRIIVGSVLHPMVCLVATFLFRLHFKNRIKR